MLIVTSLDELGTYHGSIIDLGFCLGLSESQTKP